MRGWSDPQGSILRCVRLDTGAASVTTALAARPRTAAESVLRWSPLLLVASTTVALLLVEPSDTLTSFATVFLGILFEALPFLVIGVLVSAAMQTWVSAALVQRLNPGGRLRGALVGTLLGAIFPVCECGVIPVARRLLGKGASLPAALGFLLAGPVVNPIVFVATWTALGAEMAAARLLLSLGAAVGVAWLYGFHPAPATLLRSPSTIRPTASDQGDTAQSVSGRLVNMLVAAGDELLEMSRYLIVGAAAAAALRTLVPGPSLIAIGQGPVLSVSLMMVLAALLSICSVVDAFVALSLSGLVSTGAMLAFLVFGPVVDLKSVLLYGAVFRWRTVLMIVVLLTQLVLFAGVAINLNVG